MHRTTYDRLEPGDRALVDAAREATATAYAPYSGIRVGTALRTLGGRVVTGSNVENAAYGSTICAERMAVGRANAGGERAFTAAAIAATGEPLRADEPLAPCGACRQVLLEMARATGQETRVIMAAPETADVLVATIEELLPHAFGPLPTAADPGEGPGA